jgi:hypothetical protein
MSGGPTHLLKASLFERPAGVSVGDANLTLKDAGLKTSKLKRVSSVREVRELHTKKKKPAHYFKADGERVWKAHEQGNGANVADLLVFGERCFWEKKRLDEDHPRTKEKSKNTGLRIEGLKAFLKKHHANLATDIGEEAIKLWHACDEYFGGIAYLPSSRNVKGFQNICRLGGMSAKKKLGPRYGQPHKNAVEALPAEQAQMKQVGNVRDLFLSSPPALLTRSARLLVTAAQRYAQGQ